MTSHALYPGLDPDWPATMSQPVIEGLLREKLGFEGLVITDDLEMGAIVEKWGVSQGASAAFEAGADILLICKEQQKVLESMEDLKQKLIRGDIPLQRLQRSVERIAHVKSRFLGNPRKVSLEEVATYFAEGSRRSGDAR
jgi:beta-N-acetylhexosaminidase